MRVLHFYKTYKPDSMGGVEEVISQICSGAAKHGIQSDVLTLSKDTTTVDLGDHKHYRAKLDLKIASTSFSVSSFRKFKELSQQADLIHYHYPWPFMDVVHFATGVKKPTVVTYHSDIVKQKYLLQLYRPLRDRFLDSVDTIVSTSPNYVETSAVLQRYKDKVQVIPIGINSSLYPAPSFERLEHWNRRFGEQFFLFIGNLRYYKGLHVLLEAIAGTDLKVVIVGNGPMGDQLKRQASALALTDVHFVGAVDDADKVALLSLCRAVVFPSHLRSEAFGITLLEGSMFGKPLISAELGTGTSYVNVNGITGLVVPPADPQALRDAMRRLANSEALAMELGQNARMRYEELFSSDHMVRDYVNLYRRLASQPTLS